VSSWQRGRGGQWQRAAVPKGRAKLMTASHPFKATTSPNERFLLYHPQETSESNFSVRAKFGPIGCQKRSYRSSLGGGGPFLAGTGFLHFMTDTISGAPIVISRVGCR
jgi:hypothetical protein